ncbi:MAG: hypothetical protein P8X96_25450 [Desulfobacteraceae bacterium]
MMGTIYTAQNRKIIQMAIGELGLKNMVKNGARLTICLTVPLTILECTLKDHTTMSQIIGHVATDLIKVGIRSLISAMAGLAVGSFVTVAAVPIFVTILCGVVIGAGLEAIDTQYGLTDKQVAVIEKHCEELEQKAGGILHDADSIEFNNRVGFLFIGVGLPIAHLFSIFSNFYPKVVERKSALFNYSFFILLIVLMASAFLIAARVQAFVEQTGYLRCAEADHQLTFSTGLVYTRNDGICGQLIEEKFTSQRY